MTTLAQPVDPTNPIVFLDIQIGRENGKMVVFFTSTLMHRIKCIYLHMFFSSLQYI